MKIKKYKIIHREVNLTSAAIEHFRRAGIYDISKPGASAFDKKEIMTYLSKVFGKLGRSHLFSKYLKSLDEN